MTDQSRQGDDAKYLRRFAAVVMLLLAAEAFVLVLTGELVFVTVA